MINKRMGTKIMAVLLAAVVALPSAGTVMAAEPAPARTLTKQENPCGTACFAARTPRVTAQRREKTHSQAHRQVQVPILVLAK